MVNTTKGIDLDKLIEEIEKRPALYDVTANGYNKKEFKMNLWKEVYAECILNWSTLPIETRIERGVILIIF